VPFHEPPPEAVARGAGAVLEKEVLVPAQDAHRVAVSLAPGLLGRGRADLQYPVDVIALPVLPGEREGAQPAVGVKVGDDLHINL